MENNNNNVPSWVLVAIFVLIMVILGACTDVFTFVVGGLIMTLIFAAGYNKTHLHEH